MSSDVVRRRADSLPTLTGVRGIAALAVFLCHAQPIVLRVLGLGPNQGLAIIDSGFRGVDLFFILSGFILFHVHAHDFAVLDADRVKRFYMLRFFRVYPLNTLVLLLLVPLPLLAPSFVDWHRSAHLSQGAYHARDFSWAAFVQSLLLAQTWTGLKLGTWNEPAWTLSAEVFGYACFPALALLVNRLRSSAGSLLFVLGSLSSFVLLMMLGGHGTNNPSGTFGLIRMALCFSAGVGLSSLFHMHPRVAVFAPGLAIVSAIEVLTCFGEPKLGVLSVFGFAGLIFALAYHQGAVACFTTAPVVMWLGRVSFSFYLIHLVPLEAFDYLSQRSLSADRPATMTTFLAALALPFLLATLLHRFAEVPFQKLGRTLSARPERRAPLQPSASPLERPSGSAL